MDLETAREFLDEQFELERKIAVHQPEASGESLDPMEHFLDLGRRIDTLPSLNDAGIEKHVNVDFGRGAPKLKLRTQHTVHMNGSGRSRSLVGVEATWTYRREGTSSQNRIGFLAYEYIPLGAVGDSPESLRKLTLLEQSVTAAEEFIAAKQLADSPSN